MAFWGIELKPGKPFTLATNHSSGRLHISQATLGNGRTSSKTVVQCNVGNKSPVFLCSLFPEKSESCQLNLEFEEVDVVVFSVIGPRSVHLTGYFMGGARKYKLESESYGEDIANTESKGASDHSDEDDYGDDFINDLEIVPASPDGGVNEEKLSQQQLKKNETKNECNSSVMVGTDGDAGDQPEREVDMPVMNFTEVVPISVASPPKKTEKGHEMDDETAQIEFMVHAICKDVLKQNHSQLVESSKETNVPSSMEVDESNPKPKKRRRKELAGRNICEADKEYHSNIEEVDEAQQGEVKFDGLDHTLDVGVQQADNKILEIDGDQFVKQNQLEQKEKETNGKDENVMSVETSLLAIGGKDMNTSVNKNGGEDDNKLSSDLVIQKLGKGKPKGKVATLGKKIYINYIARLKDNGLVFDSTEGAQPFKFRVGATDIIDGLNLGVEGMCVGEKRRILIPPPLGFGSGGDGEKVPPNAWVEYDIELVKIHGEKLCSMVLRQLTIHERFFVRWGEKLLTALQTRIEDSFGLTSGHHILIVNVIF